MFKNLNEVSKKRVALYIRVSTEEQAINWNWIEIQKEALIKYVDTFKDIYSLESKHIYIDEWKSWAYKENRPALYKLFKDAESKEFDIVLVWKIDRFFRKTLFLLEWIDALDRLWIWFISITQTFDTTNSFWKMILWILWLIAELERDLIKERTHSWILQTMQKWKWGRWHPPYWYTKNKDWFLEVDEEKAKIVKLIFNLFVNEWYKLSQISEYLKEMNINTSSVEWACWEKRKERLKHRNHWHKKVIGDIIRNETYIWKLTQNKYARDRKTTVKSLKPESEWIIWKCPEIINENIFKNAQEKIIKNKEFSLKNTKKEVYLLARLLVCWETWYKYVGYKSSKWTRNYRLNITKEKVLNIIPLKSISATKLEDLIWNKLSKILKNPKTLIEELEKLSLNSKERDNEIKIKIDLIDENIMKLKNNNKWLLSLSWDLWESDIEEIRKKLKENNENIRKLENNKYELQKQLTSNEEKEKQVKDLYELSKKIIGKIDYLSIEWKTEICRQLIEKVVITWDNVDIYLLVPYEDEQINKPRLRLIDNFFEEKKEFVWEMKKNTIRNHTDSVNLCNVNGG